MFKPPTGAYAATIFDLDGTLANSMPLHYQSFLHAFRELGYDVRFDEDDFYAWGGVPLREVIERLNQKNGLTMDPEAVFPIKNRFVERHHREVQPVVEVVQFARDRKAEGQPIGIASGGHREEVLRTLDAIGLTDFFPVIVTRSDVSHGKPHPETYLRAAKLLNVDPPQCLVFEDADAGAEAARAAGMDVVMVKTRV